MPLCSVSCLLRWDGTVDRGTYAFVGAIGFALKHNIDRFVAYEFFGRSFTPLNYWIPPVRALGIDRLSREDTGFLITLLVLALPFIWVGLATNYVAICSTESFQSEVWGRPPQARDFRN